MYMIQDSKILMERFIQQHIKYRTECFDDYFPCRKKKENCDKQHVRNWLKKMFLVYHNMAADRIQFMMFLIGGDDA
jgi:hypothetical protein